MKEAERRELITRIERVRRGAARLKREGDKGLRPMLCKGQICKQRPFCPYCDAAHQLVDELADLSRRILHPAPS